MDLYLCHGILSQLTSTSCNATIWFLNESSVSQSIHGFAFKDSDNKAWIELKERFIQGDLTRVLELQKEIQSIKQSNINVSDFFTTLTVL